MKRLVLALALAALALAVPTAALAAGGNGKSDVTDVGRDVKVKKPKKGQLPQAAPLTAAAVAAAEELESPPVGTQKIWPLINFATGQLSVQTFTLRAVGTRTEIWVSNNLSFPGTDCRNDGQRNVITDAQATYFAAEFSNEMYPKMTANFSSPPSRDGSGAPLPALLGAPPPTTTPARATRSSRSSPTSGTRTTLTSPSLRTSRATTRPTSTSS